jgi:hypothetical protein
MKRRDLGLVALGGLVVASGCSPQNRTSFNPATGQNAVGAVSPAANTSRIAAMTFDDVKIGTLMKFTVYHDRADVITVSATDPDMTDIKTVKKHPNATHVSIKVIANGSSGLQVFSADREFLALIISTSNVPQV